MSKKIPSVYVNPINKKINNSQELFYGKSNYERDEEDINESVKKIFNSPNHVYKTRVIITTTNDVIECDVVGKTLKSLLTLDGKQILISDIKKIQKK